MLVDDIVCQIIIDIGQGKNCRPKRNNTLQSMCNVGKRRKKKTFSQAYFHFNPIQHGFLAYVGLTVFCQLPCILL